MLASAGTIAVVANALRNYGLKSSVVDPVMVSTSGAQLLPEKAVKTLCEKLLPETFIVTPNIPEANLILHEGGQPPIEINDLDDMKQLAAAVHKLGPKYVLIKGGHLPLTSYHKVAKCAEEKKTIVNVLYGDDVEEVVELAYQESRNTHGTGCSLACEIERRTQNAHSHADRRTAAIACRLAEGQSVAKAVRMACRYVEAGIKTSVNLGKGSGPLNHFHSVQILPFAP